MSNPKRQESEEGNEQKQQKKKERGPRVPSPEGRGGKATKATKAITDGDAAQTPKSKDLLLLVPASGALVLRATQ